MWQSDQLDGEVTSVALRQTKSLSEKVPESTAQRDTGSQVKVWVKALMREEMVLEGHSK